MLLRRRGEERGGRGGGDAKEEEGTRRRAGPPPPRERPAPHGPPPQATPGQQPGSAAAVAEGGAPAEAQPPAAGPAAPLPAGAAAPAGYARGTSLGDGKVVVSAKQSGVPGVAWGRAVQAWVVKWYESAQGAKRRKKTFPLATFQQPGQGPEAAEAAALQAAVAFRRELERTGQAKAPKKLERQSGVSGVVWQTSSRSWIARLQYTDADGKRKNIYGGIFTPKDDTPEEVERARLLAVERLRELEREQGRAVEVREGAAAPRVERQSGVQGICWHIQKGAWQWNFVPRNGPDKGRRKRPCFQPKDDSPEEVERARLAAVEALQKFKEEDRAPGRAAAGGRGAGGRRAGRGRA